MKKIKSHITILLYCIFVNLYKISCFPLYSQIHNSNSEIEFVQVQAKGNFRRSFEPVLQSEKNLNSNHNLSCPPAAKQVMYDEFLFSEIRLTIRENTINNRRRIEDNNHSFFFIYCNNQIDLIFILSLDLNN